jgi:hypothetical protein
MIIQEETIILFIGFVIGFILYTYFKFRSGGVLAMPLLAIYTFNFPLLLPFIVVSTIFIVLITELLFIKFIIYGRRLLYINLILGMLLVSSFSYLFKIDLGWYPLLIPGLLSYNFHREVNSKENIFHSIFLNVVYFVSILLISVIINIFFFGGL